MPLNLHPLLAATTTVNQVILTNIGEVRHIQTTSYGMESSVVMKAHAALVPTLQPWFSVNLGSPTSDDIEVRIMGSESTNNEDTPIELLEIYVQ